MNTLFYMIICHLALGIIGFSLYMTNKDSRPKKKLLIPIALIPHLCFGIISVLYGFICFTTRKKER